jgi:hypothetical protein
MWLWVSTCSWLGSWCKSKSYRELPFTLRRSCFLLHGCAARSGAGAQERWSD